MTPSSSPFLKSYRRRKQRRFVFVYLLVLCFHFIELSIYYLFLSHSLTEQNNDKAV